MAGRLWIRVSAIWRGGLWGTGGGFVVAWWLLRRRVCRKALLSAMGGIEATEVDIASKIAGRIDTILVKEGQFVREGEVLAKMDLACCRNSNWKPSRKSKEAKAPLPPRRLCWSNDKVKLVPHSRWSIDAGRTGLCCQTSYAFPLRSPNEGLFLRNSWMTTAPPLRAPELRWNQRKPRFRLLKRL